MKYNYFFDEFTPESCYWAGFIGADGCVLNNKKSGNYCLRIRLSIRDILHIEKFKNMINVDNKIGRTKNNLCYISVGSKHMVKSLEENFNIIPRKSLILQPPNKIPRNLIKHYIRGYFDGDGHIGYFPNRTYCCFNIASGSYDIINWISKTLQLFDLIENDHIYKKHIYYIDIKNIKSINIFNWLYEDSYMNLRLDRKYEIYLKCKNSIEKKVMEYNNLGYRRPPGCNGFDININEIINEYQNKSLKELGKEYNISRWALLDRFKKNNIRKKIKTELNDLSFSTYTPESCYWAGFLISKGYIKKNNILEIELSHKKIDYLILLKQFLNCNSKILTRKKEFFKSGKYYITNTISFPSKNIIDDLNKNFDIKKDYNFLEKIPEKYISNFIYGYISGNGNISYKIKKNALRLYIYSKSKLIIGKILEVFKKNNLISQFYVIYNRGNSYSIEINGKSVDKILDWCF